MRREERSQDWLVDLWPLLPVQLLGESRLTSTHGRIHLFHLLQIKSNDHLGSIQQMPLTAVTKTCLEDIFEVISQLPNSNSFPTRKQLSHIVTFQVCISPDQNHIKLTYLVLSKRLRSKVSAITAKNLVSFGLSCHSWHRLNSLGCLEVTIKSKIWCCQP